MKNKYLTKCLCITLAAGMILAGSSSAFVSGAEEAKGSDTEMVSEAAAEAPVETQAEAPVESDRISGNSFEDGGDEFTSELIPSAPEETPSPTPEETPTPTPGEEPGVSPTPTPGETPEVSPTPTPGETPEVSPTPTPGETPEVSPTPVPELPEHIKQIVDSINEIALEDVTPELKDKVEAVRLAYDALTEEEKLLVSNYPVFEEIEKVLKSLLLEEELPPEQELPFGDGTEPIITDGEGTLTGNAQLGQAVYLTNMVSNLHAGKEFYLNSLKKNYRLEFSEDFPAVMDAIEKEYKQKNKLSDNSDTAGSKVTSSADSLLVRNWQDIIAIYIYENQKKDGTYVLDASCKKELAKIFEEMNPVVRDKKHITRVSYGNRHINYYIKKNEIPKEKRRILKKYVDTDCKLLSATVTGARGFVRQSVGDEVSEERVNVISAAYSLVGKVGYFWGGKSTEIGEDSRWGKAAKVSAPGSNSTGTLRAYGLDCSGFVTWAVINGYEDKDMEGVIGNGTSDQWMKANVISEADAQPGDLVFQRGPEAGSDNHVGILCGKTEAGDWIAVHCSSGKNGVTVGEAYGASFRYIRQPSFYPSAAERQEMVQGNTPSLNTGTSIISSVTVNDSMKELLSSGQPAGGTNTPAGDFIGPELSILKDKIVLADDDIEVFKGE